MEFVIQVNSNPSHDYVCIHNTRCSHARKSLLLRRKPHEIHLDPYYETQNTSWYGPFDTYEEALRRAKKFLVMQGVRDCSFCMPMKYKNKA